MKKSLLTTLCAISALLFIPASAHAMDYTIETLPAPATPVLSKALPFVPQTSTGSSVSQQVYLASELTALGATAGDITGIKFYYGGYNNNTAVPSMTRTIKIYITELATDSLEIYEIASAYTTNYRFKFKNPGTSPVHEGTITTEAIAAGEVKALSINFNQSSYAWDGSKNILVTVYDVTNTAYTSSEGNLRFVLKTTEHARFVHYYWTAAGDHNASEYLGASLNGMVGENFTSGSDGTAKDKQVRGHRYIPKTTFSISTTIPAPTNLAASSITTSSATLSWNAAAGATGYNVRWGKTSGSLDHSQNNVAATSLAISDLDDGETYYFDVQTITAGGTSAWASEASFNTTAITHIHDGITFSKWASTTAMPTSGNYYLANNVTYDFYEGGYLDLAGDLNLCLNGNTINLGTKSINVTNGHTMTIFDPIGGGKITGLVAGDDGSLTFKGVISVENGGTLVLREGEVENTKPSDDPDYKSIAIASGGTLIISGEPVISGNDIDIFLAPTIPAKVITIQSGKPLTNSTPYKVYKTDGVLTSGWANMSGANPKDYLVSANPDKIVYYNGSEADLKTALNLSESSANSSIGDNYNQTVDVNLTRSTLTNASFNTFCLPFALSAAQMEEFFGAGYDLEEFVSSSFDGDVLLLEFNKVTTGLVAGKPYLLKPANNVTNPAFEGVTIGATSPVDQTSDTYISFHGTFAPTELTGGNKNLLFLGADNELFWPASTGNLKGFRAYFEVKGDARRAVRARIVQSPNSSTGIEETRNGNADAVRSEKILRDGQLFIIRGERIYNAQGQMVK